MTFLEKVEENLPQLNIKLTTDHSASSYGIPVAIINGQAYGPDDIYEGVPVASYIIVNIKGDRPDLDDMFAFLKQSPDAYQRGLDALERWEASEQRTQCEMCGSKRKLYGTRSGHKFCCYACFEDFFGGEIAEDDDFLDIPE